MKRTFRKKLLISMTAITMCLTPSMFAQKSLLSTATNGLFENANDWILRPNAKFNTLQDNYLIIAGEYGTEYTSITSGNGMAELGYYHPGKVPFAFSGGLKMISDPHLTENINANDATNSKETTKYKNPAFNNWNAVARFTIGFPGLNGGKALSNLSIGARVNVTGHKNNGYEITKTNDINGATNTTTTVDMQLDNIVSVAVPIGMQLGAVYNYFMPYLIFNLEENQIGNDLTKTNTFSFFIYDKLTFKSLIPKGAETNIWVGAGSDAVSLPELEFPAYGTETNKYTGGQVGIANKVDFSIAGGIDIVLNPKLYFDWRTGKNMSYDMGVTLASDLGMFAKIGTSPISLFFGFTPRLQFSFGRVVTIRDTLNNTLHETIVEQNRNFSTNILWSGKLGMNILLPNNSSCDITLNVNTKESLVNLSAHLTIALPTRQTKKAATKSSSASKTDNKAKASTSTKKK